MLIFCDDYEKDILGVRQTMRKKQWGLVLYESNKDPVRTGGNAIQYPPPSGERPYPWTVKGEHFLQA